MTKRQISVLTACAAIILRLLVWTLRIRVRDVAGFLNADGPHAIWLFWHNRMLVIPHLLNRYAVKRKGSALISMSKDGEILAALLSRFNVRAVRGSSSRRGVVAMRELIRMIESGYDVAITPDGPRGPRYTLASGALTLAQSSGAKVLPIRVHYSHCFRLRSWDAFQIPFPFARVEITLLPLEAVAATVDETAFDMERHRLERLLREGQDDDTLGGHRLKQEARSAA